MPLHFLVLLYIRAILATQLCPPAEEGTSYHCHVTVNNTEERTVVLRRDGKVYAQCDLVKTDTDCHNVDNTDLTVGLDVRETNVTFEFRMANVTRDNDQAMWSVETYLDKAIPDVLFRFRTLVYVKIKDVQLNTTWSSKGLIVTIVVPVLTYQPTQIKLLHDTPKTASSCNNTHVGKKTPNFRSTCVISLDVEQPTKANLDFLLYPKISGLSEDEGVGYSKNITITIEEPKVKIKSCTEPPDGQLVTCICQRVDNSDVPTNITWSIASSSKVDTSINLTTISFTWMENITHIDCLAKSALGNQGLDRHKFKLPTSGTNSNQWIVVGTVIALLIVTLFVFCLYHFYRDRGCQCKSLPCLRDRQRYSIELNGTVQKPANETLLIDPDQDATITEIHTTLENGHSATNEEVTNPMYTSSPINQLQNNQDYLSDQCGENTNATQENSTLDQEENDSAITPLIAEDETDTIIQSESPQLNNTQLSSLEEITQNILLVGAYASGKSSTGNSILMKKFFQFSNGVSPCTIKVEVGTAIFGGGVIKVVDTPGEITKENVRQYLDVCKEGYHACLIVHRFGYRLLKTEHIIEGITRYFNDQFISKFGIIIVTGGDTFIKEEADFTQWCRSQKGVFKNLYDMCGKRAILFDNKTRDQDKQRQQQLMLMGVIQGMNPQSIACVDILNTESNPNMTC